ncbi:MAG: patatin-like phospholipase family protein [Flexilinea sp.]
MEDAYGLVLSGGGTKGAYEIGAWKALKKMGIPIRGIAGTSIGAINGALILQEDQQKSEQIYRNIHMSDILGTTDSFDPQKSLFSIDNMRGLVKEYLMQKGLDNAPLKNLIESNIDLDKIYGSDMDFGIVAYSLRDFTVVEKFKEDIPKDEMVNSLLASASFPIFKPQKVKGKQYVDGGVYDNMPINMLIKKGYKRIIVIDIAGMGIKRRLEKKKDIYVKMIRCSEDLGGTFEFDSKKITRNLQMGYLDTLKAFQKLQGHYYYFSRKSFNSLLQSFSLNVIYGLETAAKFYGLDRYKVYSVDSFLSELMIKHADAQSRYDQYRNRSFISKLIRNPGKILEMVDNGLIVVLFEELIESWPGQDSGRIAKLFEDYSLAGTAMIELQNYLQE